MNTRVKNPERTCRIICLALLAWLLLSFLEVAFKNLSPEPVYGFWNIFSIAEHLYILIH